MIPNAVCVAEQPCFSAYAVPVSGIPRVQGTITDIQCNLPDFLSGREMQVCTAGVGDGQPYYILGPFRQSWTEYQVNHITSPCLRDEKSSRKCLTDKEMEKARGILASFRQLETGWDGYQADCIEEKSISAAEGMLDSFPIMPDIFPTLNGNVQFQFEDDKGNYLELEVLPDGMADMYRKMDGEEEELTINRGVEREWKYLMEMLSRLS